MKKLMIAALAVASCSAFAEFDTEAKADGFYDVQLTLKRLVHAEKKISMSFKLPGKEAEYIKAYQAALDERIPETEVSAVTNTARTSVKLSYTRYDYKLNGEKKVYKSKILSETYKGLYAPTAVEDGNGKVYLWSTLAGDKVDMLSTDTDALPFVDKAKGKKTKGFKAYEVPLALHGEFQRTHDDKVAGGFKGGKNKALDGTLLDFEGLTAFGTGTKDKGDNGLIKSVAGNVASKSDTEKVGAYGTWKINRITSKNFPKDVKGALVKKGCVELVLEKDN